MYYMYGKICLERPLPWETTCFERPHILSRMSYISMYLNLSPQSTCLERPHFYGHCLSRQILLNCAYGPNNIHDAFFHPYNYLRSNIPCCRLSEFIFFSFHGLRFLQCAHRYTHSLKTLTHVYWSRHEYIIPLWGSVLAEFVWNYQQNKMKM